MVRLFTFLLLLLASPVWAAPVLERELGSRITRVPEFAAIREEAAKLGVRVWLFGGTAASYAHYVKDDLAREAGKPGYRPDRFDYDYTNIFRSTQDLDIVVDGSAAQADALERTLKTKFPHFLGDKAAQWEVRALREARGEKEAILGNPDFQNQHTDSHSTGMVEVSAPTAGESAVRDVRDWEAKGKPQFLRDVEKSELHYYFSPSHAETARAKAGKNPPLLSAVRYLTKAFQYDLKMAPEDFAKVKSIIDAFDPRQPFADPYVATWIEKNGKKLFQHAVNLEYAWNTLEQLGLRAKLIALKRNPNELDSLAWWMSREPLRTKEVGRGSGKTAAQLLGKDLTLSHETNSLLAFESITRARDGSLNGLISRSGYEGEAAVHGEGFYTMHGRKGARGTGLTVRMEISPEAREGWDFVRGTDDMVILRNKGAVRVLPEEFSFSLPEFFRAIAEGKVISGDDRALLEKFRRRVSHAILSAGDEAEIVKIMKKAGPQGSPALVREWFNLPAARTHPEISEVILRDGPGGTLAMLAQEMLPKPEFANERNAWTKLLLDNRESFVAHREIITELWPVLEDGLRQRIWRESSVPTYGAQLAAGYAKIWPAHPEWGEALLNEPGAQANLLRGLFRRPDCYRDSLCRQWIERYAADPAHIEKIIDSFTRGTPSELITIVWPKLKLENLGNDQRMRPISTLRSRVLESAPASEEAKAVAAAILRVSQADIMHFQRANRSPNIDVLNIYIDSAAYLRDLGAAYAMPAHELEEFGRTFFASFAKDVSSADLAYTPSAFRELTQLRKHLAKQGLANVEPPLFRIAEIQRAKEMLASERPHPVALQQYERNYSFYSEAERAALPEPKAFIQKRIDHLLQHLLNGDGELFLTYDDARKLNGAALPSAVNADIIRRYRNDPSATSLFTRLLHSDELKPADALSLWREEYGDGNSKLFGQKDLLDHLVRTIGKERSPEASEALNQIKGLAMATFTTAPMELPADRYPLPNEQEIRTLASIEGVLGRESVSAVEVRSYFPEWNAPPLSEASLRKLENRLRSFGTYHPSRYVIALEYLLKHRPVLDDDFLHFADTFLAKLGDEGSGPWLREVVALLRGKPSLAQVLSAVDPKGFLKVGSAGFRPSDLLDRLTLRDPSLLAGLGEANPRELSLLLHNTRRFEPTRHALIKAIVKGPQRENLAPLFPYFFHSGAAETDPATTRAFVKKLLANRAPGSREEARDEVLATIRRTDLRTDQAVFAEAFHGDYLAEFKRTLEWLRLPGQDEWRAEERDRLRRALLISQTIATEDELRGLAKGLGPLVRPEHLPFLTRVLDEPNVQKLLTTKGIQGGSVHPLVRLVEESLGRLPITEFEEEFDASRKAEETFNFYRMLMSPDYHDQLQARAAAMRDAAAAYEAKHGGSLLKPAKGRSATCAEKFSEL